MSTKWVTWADEDVKKEGSTLYGEGPFLVTAESDEGYYVLVPMRMPRGWLSPCNTDVFQEKVIKQAVGADEGGGCSGKCSHSGQAEAHPLAGYRSKADPKHVQKSPYTSQYSVGDTVRTPGGVGTVQEVTWRQAKVGGARYDWKHVFPENE